MEERTCAGGEQAGGRGRHSALRRGVPLGVHLTSISLVALLPSHLLHAVPPDRPPWADRQSRPPAPRLPSPVCGPDAGAVVPGGAGRQASAASPVDLPGLPARAGNRRLTDVAGSPRIWFGRRDHALLLVAWQAGLGLSELTGLQRADVALGAGAHVRCLGKGRKERCTPLTKTTVAAFPVSEAFRPFSS
jgi:hypothetical protein